MALQQNVIDQVHTYTDFSGLNSLKAQARNDKNAALETVSKQFEAMFLNMVMKSMRDANKAFSEGNFMNSSQMEFYQQMFDSQLTQTLSKGNGIGIAKALLTQMSAQIEGVTQAADEPRHIDYGGIQSYAREMPAQAIQILETVVEVDEMVKRDHPGSASGHDSVTGDDSAEVQLDNIAAGVAGMDRLLSNPAVLADKNTRDREEEETEIDVDGIAENETETGE